MQNIWRTAAVIPTFCLLACGSSSKHAADGGLTPPEVVQQPTGDAAAVKTITNSSYSSKMARQAHDDTQQQADTSETATSGKSDGGGTRSLVSGQAEDDAGFAITVAPGTDFNNISADFHGHLNFQGSHEGAEELNGTCDAQVSHKGSNDLSTTLVVNMNRTLPNGDVVGVVTEPNIVLTRVGSRALGTITRTINGQVHRTLTGAADANRDFDLTIQHAGTVVVDTYASGTQALEKRLINGTVNVTDHTHGLTSAVKHIDILRGAPQQCLCPTGGSIEQTITKDNVTETHTYKFGGTCGQSTVSVDGAASVAAAGSVTAGNPNDTASVNASSSVTAKLHATGTLSWEQCLPTAN